MQLAYACAAEAMPAVDSVGNACLVVAVQGKEKRNWQNDQVGE